ncbi:MAG TPA: helix-turn-helix transcriptional regulator [Jatrophihabitans sp.]|nr:helix-turn-helix transcriptional regulator [Jatrophihabitans sp.]
MQDFQPAPNQLETARLRAGIASTAELATKAGIDAEEYEHIESGRLLPTVDQLRSLQAALGGVPAERLYGGDMLQILGAVSYVSAIDSPEGVRDWVRGPMKLFVARNEVTWWERRSMPDEPVEAFFSLSCGTRAMPHLLLDAIACAKALGIRIVAASGAAGCCGKPVLSRGKVEAGEEFTLSKLRYAQSIGATTTVMSCHACQQTAAITMARREILGKPQPAMRQMWTGSFFAEKLAELGDRVPWKQAVNRRVLVGWYDNPGVMSVVSPDMERLLSLIPGVTVVGRVEGELAELDPKAPLPGKQHNGIDGRSPLPQWTAPESAAERTANAARLADLAAARGADTICWSHFSDHYIWGRYASDRLAVRHPVSILAEALGCDHPDRAQAAGHLGDPVEVVRQTRSIWSSWGLTEADALELATSSIYPTTGGFTGCRCGTHAESDVIPIDVVRGVSPGLAPIDDAMHATHGR